jgi:ribose 5-phosphate isomerase B
MRIALASDHAGYELKSGVADYLRGQGIVFEDYGCGAGESVDYVDYGARAARAVIEGACDRAILICGTGLGMGIVANKFKGIRATPCPSEYAAEMSRRHNDSNCLTLGGRTHSLELALRLVRIWLDTEFEGGRHTRDIEAENFK